MEPRNGKIAGAGDTTTSYKIQTLKSRALCHEWHSPFHQIEDQRSLIKRESRRAEVYSSPGERSQSIFVTSRQCSQYLVARSGKSQQLATIVSGVHFSI